MKRKRKANERRKKMKKIKITLIYHKFIEEHSFFKIHISITYQTT